MSRLERTSARRTSARGRLFSRMGSDEQPASRMSRTLFFVTGPDARLGPNSGSLVPTGRMVHAKQMGTLVTACGIATSSWTKLWDVPFSRSSGRACPECVEIVAAHASWRAS